MIQPASCYMSSADYCIRDPDFLDQVLRRLLGHSTLRELVTDQAEFQRLIREATGAYGALASTEDGLSRVSRLTEERFAHPVITVTGETVRADYAHIGAKITTGARGKIGIAFSESPHLTEHWEWQTTEAAKALQSLLDKYPDADVVQARVLIPGGLQTSEWIYSYRRTIGPTHKLFKEDRIHVLLPMYPQRDYYTGPINHDLGPYLRGEASLYTGGLEHALHK